MTQKSGILKVSADDIDGVIQIKEEGPVNILREKTFNPELSTLLNKIYSHEKVSSELTQTGISEFIDPSAKNRVLLNCDRLIYKLKHIQEASTVSSSFNPFSLDINVYDDIDDLNDYISAGITQAGFSSFLTMKYIFKDAAFRTDLNKTEEYFNSNCFFSIKDPVFHMLRHNRNGIVLTADDIITDEFLNKKLRNPIETDDSVKPVYFVKISSICGWYNQDSHLKENLNEFEEFLSPVLAIRIDNNTALLSADKIYDMLQRTTVIPLSIYLLKNRIIFDSSEYSYEDALLMLELFGNFPSESNKKTFLITLDSYSAKENIFILKFLLSRIKKRLNNNSLFLRVSIDKCILIASDEEIGDIREYIEEINSYDRLISFEESDWSNKYHFTRLFL